VTFIERYVIWCVVHNNLKNDIQNTCFSRHPIQGMLFFINTVSNTAPVHLNAEVRLPQTPSLLAEMAFLVFLVFDFIPFTKIFYKSLHELS